jgi:hypothetical protein
MHSLEWPGVFAGEMRTVALVGGGVRLPIAREARFNAVALAGVDAVNRTSTLVPAAALRVGVEWSPGGSFLDTFGVSLTGMSDLQRYRNELGERIGETTVSTAITFGFRMRQRSR